METCFPILDETLAQRVKVETLDNYLADNQNAWELQANGEYRRVEVPENVAPYSAQAALLEKICG